MRAALLALALLALAACSGKKPPEIDTETIVFDINRQANRDFPVAVDLVHVLDVAAIERIGALSATEWFQQRAQVVRDYPTGLVVTSYELVPGQVVPMVELGDPEDDAHASFVFAGYFTPGVHRARIDRIEHARVELGRESFTVSAQP